MSLKLYRETGNGEYITLAGAGIIIELIHDAIQTVGADPNDVVLRFTDGNRGSSIDVMFPTPHTYLFKTTHIRNGEIRFELPSPSEMDEKYNIPLANPDVASEIADAIRKRAKKHRKTRIALNC